MKNDHRIALNEMDCLLKTKIPKSLKYQLNNSLRSFIGHRVTVNVVTYN